MSLIEFKFLFKAIKILFFILCTENTSTQNKSNSDSIESSATKTSQIDDATFYAQVKKKSFLIYIRNAHGKKFSMSLEFNVNKNCDRNL